MTAPDPALEIDPRQMADVVTRLLRSEPEGLDAREVQRRVSVPALIADGFRGSGRGS